MKLWRILEPPTFLFAKLVFWWGWESWVESCVTVSCCRPKSIHWTWPFTIEYTLTGHTTPTFPQLFLLVLPSCTWRNFCDPCCLPENSLNVLVNFARSAHYGLPACFSWEAASCSEGLRCHFPSVWVQERSGQTSQSVFHLEARASLDCRAAGLVESWRRPGLGDEGKKGAWGLESASLCEVVAC